MRSVASVLAVSLFFVSFGSGCTDPNSPEFWIRKLKDIRERKEARRQLVKLDKPAAVPALMDLYKEEKDPETLKAIVHFHDKRSVPLLITVLSDFSEETVDPCSIAAVEPLIKVLENKKIPIRSRANIVKQEAMRSLTKFGKDPKAVEALSTVLTRSADEQDFFLNKFAAIQLGNIGDPRGIPALTKGLFMTGRGAVIYQECRIALAQIGEPAADPMIELLQEKNEAINEMRKKLDFDKYTPGVVPHKAAAVLGDLRPKKAIPILLARLKEKLVQPKDEKTPSNPMKQSILVTLGQYGDPSVMPDVLAILNDPTAREQERSTAASALNFIGDRKALPALWNCVSSAKMPPNVRVACGNAFASLGTDADFAKMEALATKEGYDEFKMGVVQLKLAKECKTDPACFGKTFSQSTTKNESLYQMLKAAYELGRLERGASIKVILDSLGKTDQLEVEQALLFSLTRQAGKDCKECREKVKTLMEKQEKTPTKIAKALGDDLKVAYAQLGH